MFAIIWYDRFWRGLLYTFLTTNKKTERTGSVPPTVVVSGYPLWFACSCQRIYCCVVMKVNRLSNIKYSNQLRGSVLATTKTKQNERFFKITHCTHKHSLLISAWYCTTAISLFSQLFSFDVCFLPVFSSFQSSVCRFPIHPSSYDPFLNAMPPSLM